MTTQSIAHARRVLLVALLVLAGCGGDPKSAAQPAPASATTGDPALDRELATLKAGAQTFVDAALAHDLTMPHVRAWARAALEGQRLVSADTALERRWEAVMQVNGTSYAIDAVVARAEREPAMRRVVEGAGLSMREFLLITMVLPPAVEHHDRSAQEPGRARPAWVGERHVGFVRANRAEIGQLLARLDAEDEAEDEAEDARDDA